MPGNFCSQRKACAASRPCRLNSPPPLLCRSSPSSFASSPGAVSDSLPLPPCAAGWASSWPLSSASSLRTRRADSRSVPPAGWAFQLPVALASRSCKRCNVPGDWLATVPVACTLASKPTAAPWLRTVARPSRGRAASRLCSMAALRPCSVACNCQACGCAAVLRHSPLASSSPPPSCALSACTRPTPSRHSPWACRRASGSRCWSQGPGRRLASCSCSNQAWPAAAVSPDGRTLALPLSCVCGAPGHSAAMSRSRKSASACGSGCAAQGVMRALALAWGCACVGFLSAAGRAVICSAAFTSSSVSGPRAVALNASGTEVLLSGRAAVKAPDKLTSSMSGAREDRTARPL